MTQENKIQEMTELSNKNITELATFGTKSEEIINPLTEAFGKLGQSTEKAKVSMEEISKIAEQNEAILAAEAQHWAGIDCSIKVSREIRRNDPCPCGSGKKAKNCCGAGKRHIPINIHNPKTHVFK